MASNEVCYLDTRIKQGDDSTPYHISVYDKRDDFDFRIVNFPHMDSNIPANPAYGIYISQLVRYARISTSKADFLHRLCQVSSRLHRQGFKSAFLLKSLTKFFNRHGAIIGKFDTTQRELRTAVPRIKGTAVSFLFIYLFVTFLLFIPSFNYLTPWFLYSLFLLVASYAGGMRTLTLCACFLCLVDVYASVYILTVLCNICFPLLLDTVSNCAHLVGGSS